MNTYTMDLPSEVEVREAIGDTWFDVAVEDNLVMIDTRLHGDVGEGAVGQRDIEEARSVARALLVVYERPEWSIQMECVDEWVQIELRPREMPYRKKVVRANGMVGVVPLDSLGGFKGAVGYLCDNIPARWINREHAFVMSRPAFHVFRQAVAQGWSAPPRLYGDQPRALTDPKGVDYPYTEAKKLLLKR